MKKIAQNIVLVLLVAALLGLAGGFWYFVGQQAIKDQLEEESKAIIAMYVEIGSHGDFMFVQNETETVFTAEIPEKHVYELRGDQEWKIDRDDLVSGDILKLYGEGVMLESDPGQYPGVTRVVRVSKGEPEDTEKYQERLEEYRPI